MPQPVPWFALAGSLLYGAALVVGGELIRRRAGVPGWQVRKAVHLVAGLWVFPALAAFPTGAWAAVPPLAAAVANWALAWTGWVPTLAEGGVAGPVLYPLAVAILAGWGWSVPATVTTGVVALALGDPVAALAGRRWPWGRYRPGPDGKTLSGTAALFAACLVVLALVLALWHRWPWRVALPAAVLLAAVAALAEAAGHRGLDNLLVPLATGGTAWLVATGRLLPATVDRLALAVGMSAAIGAVASVRGALAPSGVLGAVVTGTATFGLGGWAPGAALVAFFVSSSLLSHAFGWRKAELEARVYAKGSRRDLGQALANGGVAAALCVLGALWPDTAWPDAGGWEASGPATRWVAGALGALAAACADTWATEVGAAAPGQPRLVTTGRPVPPGTSGAVSAVGLAAAAAGALFTAALGWGAGWAAGAALPADLFWAPAVGGLAGSLADSLLGATVQGAFLCPVCGTHTERARHCGVRAVRVRGWPWLGNDLVNALATAAGAAVSLLLVSW